MVIVGKHINGITLNPLEYLLDDEGQTMEFENEATAKKFLRGKGLTDEEIESLVFEDADDLPEKEEVL